MNPTNRIDEKINAELMAAAEPDDGYVPERNHRPHPPDGATEGEGDSRPKSSRKRAPLTSTVKQAIASLPQDLVTNRVTVSVDDDNHEEGSTKEASLALSMAEILERTRTQTDDWPRRVDDVLFVHDDHGVSHLEKPHSLFGWLHSSVGHVQ